MSVDLTPDSRARLAAFTPEWERMGVIAARFGERQWHWMQREAKALIKEGLVEQRMYADCHRYRITDAGAKAIG